MAIDGSRSNFPAALDDWGNEYENNVCQRWSGERWNEIQDAVYALERQTQRGVQAGNDAFPAPVEDWGRPRMLVKVVTAVIAGPAAETKDFVMPAFSAAEKALFDGEPLDFPNTVTLQVRIITRDTVGQRNYVVSLKTPVSDLSGDSGWTVTISPLRDAASDGSNLKVGAGTYVITVMINR